MRIDIRKIPDGVAIKLGKRAKKSGKSREGYIRDQLIRIAENPELSGPEQVTTSLQEATLLALDENTKLLKRINDILDQYEEVQQEVSP